MSAFPPADSGSILPSAPAPAMLEALEQAACQVKIPVFEGPLDLLLHLIRKNEVDIYDIPVAKITAQYLEYLDLMETLNIEVAGEFLVMAATLIQVKSRLLLPGQAGADEAEDPRLEITRPLLEYLSFREAARRLEDRFWLDRDVFVRGEQDEVRPPQEDRPLFNLGLFDLIGAFREILNRLPLGRDLAVKMAAVSLTDRIGQLLEAFRHKPEALFSDLFPPQADLGHLVVTFLAVLELARLGFVDIFQETAFGPIRLLARPESFRPEVLEGLDLEEAVAADGLRGASPWTS